MICFKKIKWRNLLSTGNQWTEIDLNKKSNTVIIGTNGAGKSTMLDALTFVLFNNDIVSSDSSASNSSPSVKSKFSTILSSAKFDE